MIGLSGDSDSLRSHFSNDSNGNAWAREWVAHDKVVVNVKLSAELTNLILEQLSEGLDQLEPLL